MDECYFITKDIGDGWYPYSQKLGHAWLFRCDGVSWAYKLQSNGSSNLKGSFELSQSSFCGPLFLETASKVALLWAQNVMKCPCYMVSELGDMELSALNMEVKFRHACRERCFKWLIACNIAC